MRTVAKVLGAVDKTLLRLERILVTILFFALIAVILLQVVCRYIFVYSIPGTDEISRFAYVWLCWIAAGFALAGGAHINIDTIDTMLGKTEKGKKALHVIDVISEILSIAILIVFLCFYSKYYGNILSGTQYSTTLKIPYAVPMAAVLVGTVLMIEHSVYKLIPQRYKEPDETREKLIGDKPQD